MEKKEAIREYCITEAMKILTSMLETHLVTIDDVILVAKKLESYIIE